MKNKTKKQLLREIEDLKEKYGIIEKEFLYAQKFESIAILAGGIAHDFNNILTGILGNISLAKLYAEEQSNVIEKLTEAERSVIRAKDLTHQILSFSGSGKPLKKIMTVSELIRDSASFAVRGSNVRCEFMLRDDMLAVEIDQVQFNQALQNIIINALQAMPEGGTITIIGENIDVSEGNSIKLPEGRYVRISIRDTGAGIPEEHLQKIFDPCFTTKKRGSGFGLSIAYSIIRNHQGHISVESRIGEGTILHIYLPAAGAA
jgi:signal transduction histidine kinase